MNLYFNTTGGLYDIKKLLALFLGLAFMLTSFAPDAFGQTRRKKKKYRGWQPTPQSSAEAQPPAH
ncbi:MAG: hypothetical protein M3R14_03800 [Acidobacteriota bacterium]|nr:hypothetical protein [Acidobacteriota bacterium]